MNETKNASKPGGFPSDMSKPIKVNGCEIHTLSDGTFQIWNNGERLLKQMEIRSLVDATRIAKTPRPVSVWIDGLECKVTPKEAKKIANWKGGPSMEVRWDAPWER
jgi:hypothetical protein